MPTFRTTRKQRGRGSGGITGKGFTPGRSGNPAGRPRGFVPLIRQCTSDGEELVNFMLKVFRGESINEYSPRLEERLKAGTWLADRGFGRPVQAIDNISEEPEKPFDLSRLSSKELDTLERILIKTQLTEPA